MNIVKCNLIIFKIYEIKHTYVKYQSGNLTYIINMGHL